MSTPLTRGRGKRLAAALGAVGCAALAAGLVGASGPAGASSHREAPLIAGDPAVDNTDVYAFTSPEDQDTVTLVANFSPFQEPNGGPNFYPFATDARYDLDVDNDGDAKADLTYRFTFQTEDKRGKSTFLYADGVVTTLDDENLLFRQSYTLEVVDQRGNAKKLVQHGKVAPSNTGPKSMPDYGALRDQAITSAQGGLKVYAGQADDSFFLDLRVFDLLYGGDLSEVGQDTLRGFNANTIALQIPKRWLALKGDPRRNPVIGVWSDTERRSMQLSPGKYQAHGDWVQVSRLGNPLVNEVVVPAALKDRFNSLTPDQDGEVEELVDRVTDPELPRLVESIYRVPAPKGNRDDLVEIFLTGITTKLKGPIQADLNSQLDNADVNPKRFAPSEQLRLNMGTPVAADPNRLGVLAKDFPGFPNGRRLTDDVVDISLQALEGAAVSGVVQALAAGDKVDSNENAFGRTFPYVALPNNTSVNAGAAEVAIRPTAGAAEVAIRPTAGASGMPTAPLVSGLLAVLLIGAGFWVFRNRAKPTTAPTE